MYRWYSYLAKQLGIFLEVKHTFTMQSSNLTPRCLPKRNETVCPHKSLYTNVHSNTTPNSQSEKQLKCPSPGEWLNNVYSMAIEWNTIQQ